MTFLPVLERELRVRARSRANYWGRLVVAAVGLLVCVPPLIWSGPFPTPGTTGRGAFHALLGTAFLLCCAACLLTADAISGERRRGTLPLLLLTRVSHFDVLVGKFASSGLACVLALMAFLPVLVLPVLTGGVTGPEAARTAAALLNALFLALSVGLWASARGTDPFDTARAALLVLAGLVLGPVLLGLLVPRTHAALASPLGTIYQASDLAYKASPARYWLSFGVVHIFVWAFLLSAIVCLRSRPDRLEDEASRGTSHGAAPAASPPTAAPTNCRYCGRQNPADAVCCHECGTELYPRYPQTKHSLSLSSAPTPLHWLLSRQRGLKPMLWVAALAGFVHFLLYAVADRFFGWGVATFVGLSWAFNLITAALTGALFAWVASRFSVEARRSGELELLLTTPLGAEQLVSAQWDFLKRLAWLPVLVMLSPWVLQGLAMLSIYHFPDPWRLYYSVSAFLNAANTILGVAALCWVGLWFGFRAMGQARTIIWAVLLVDGLPYAVSLACSALYRLLVAPGNALSITSWVAGSLLPQVARLAFYFWLLRTARSHLLHDLGEPGPLDLRYVLSGALPRITATFRRARRWPAI